MRLYLEKRPSLTFGGVLLKRRNRFISFIATIVVSTMCLSYKTYAAAPTNITRQQAQSRGYDMAYVLWNYARGLNGNVNSGTELPDQLKGKETSQEFGVPYNWGGLDGIDTTSVKQWSSFLDGINKGAMAGNVQTEGGYKAGTAGLDCSGFVQSSLKIPGWKQSTSTLGQYLNPISIDDLRNMDVLLDKGSHVAFFQSWVYDDYGQVIGATTLEATDGNRDGSGQKVKEYYRSKSELTSRFTLGRYKYIGNDFIENNASKPIIEAPLYRQAVNNNENKIYFKWDFTDTANGGYQTAYRIRIYEGDIEGSSKFITQISENTSATEKVVELQGMHEGNYYYILETKNSRGYWSNPVVTPFKIVSDINNVQTKIDKIERFGGQDRYETSRLIAEKNFGSSLDSVVIASGNDFPDGLAGVTLAKKVNAPLLLVDKSLESKGSSNILEYITNTLNKDGKIYILGGEGSVDNSYVEYLKEKGYSDSNIIRIGGLDRNETSVKIAESLSLEKGTPIVISNDSAFADALSISPKAGSSQWPILLTSSNKLHEEVEEYIKDIQPSAVYIVGGTGVITDNVKDKIKQITGLDNSKIVRLGGSDRYQTGEAINNYFYANNLDKVFVAYGENFPDSLSGSAAAAIEGKPLILVSDYSFVNGARSINRVTGANKVDVSIFGGDKIVTNYLISKIDNLCLKLQ